MAPKAWTMAPGHPSGSDLAREVPPRIPSSLGDLLSVAHQRAYRWRSVVAMAVYAGLFTAAYLVAYLLRFDFSVPAEQWSVFLATLPTVVGIRLIAARFFDLTATRWRFVGTADVLRLAMAGMAGTATIWAATVGIPGVPSVPRSVLLLDWLLVTAATGALWVCYRVLFERIRRVGTPGEDAARAVIIGSGEAGNMLAREIVRYPTGFQLAGFVDDDSAKWGARIHGAEVRGPTGDLEEIVEATGADVIIVAVPSAAPEDLRRIVARCRAVDVPFKVLPGIAEVLEGNVRATQLRSLEVEDLLGREPVTLELPELRDDLGGRSVLITGGAGSIGAELARQVAANGPARLILLDHAESDLFFIERELRERHPSLAVSAVVADILDREALERVFRAHRPERVFHAAAYKHVPLMEANPKVAVRNNVLGTWRVAGAAARFHAGKFVLVSTDKAVDPSSVMGASKRMAELAVVAAGREYPNTSFLAVRFGNVLGSNGSVVPVFRRQLETGEPITVTHPEVTRYFMTISEAVQLVLQASLLEEGRGSIAMLDMGEPVRIVDLARNMIRLSGLREGVDARIEFTGLRPGEKLHEELTGTAEEAEPTAVDKVRLVRARNAPDPVATRRTLEAMEEQLGAMEPEDVRTLLWSLVRSSPVAEIQSGGPRTRLERVAL